MLKKNRLKKLSKTKICRKRIGRKKKLAKKKLGRKKNWAEKKFGPNKNLAKKNIGRNIGCHTHRAPPPYTLRFLKK
jgi:hypothetical protein